MPPTIFNNILSAFKKLWGYNKPINQIPGSEIDGVAVLLEENFVKNIKFVIGTDCPFFGKMLYLYFAEGLDQVKVTLSKFVQGLKIFVLDEEKQNQQKTCFKILDIDRDGVLNIINLAYLQKGIPAKSTFGQELQKVIAYYLTNNLFNKSARHRFDINLEVYLKAVRNRICLVQEIRKFLLGVNGSLKEMTASNTLNAVVDSDAEEEEEGYQKKGKKKANPNQAALDLKQVDSAFKVITDPEKLVGFKDFSHLFDGLDKDIVEDVSCGQRGFDRNIDRLTH